MVHIDKHTRLARALQWVELFEIKQEALLQYLEQIKHHPLPVGWSVRFDDLKFRELIDFQERIKTFEDLMFLPLLRLFGLNRRAVLISSAFDVLRFALYVKDELERITKLFNAIRYTPSAEEVRAGIHKLNHGFFGTIDWYARRMGYRNHDEVVEVNWTVIYQCLKIDYENNQFQRRYRMQMQRRQGIIKV